MRTTSRFPGVLFVLSLVAAAVLVAAMAGPARADITLDGTPQTYSGEVSGTSVPGVNGSYFDNIEGSTYLNLDGASYNVVDGRCFSGTQGLIGQTPTVNAPVYTGEIRGFGMFSGVGGDHFSTAFSGTFTPQGTGDQTYNFAWSNDDLGAMYIDKSGDGVFQSSERVGDITWHNESGVNVTLNGGTAYNYIYMTSDTGGGYNNDWYITPQGGTQMRPNASDSAQAGMWNVGSITYGPLDFSSDDLIVNANTTLTLNSSSNVPFNVLRANDGTATIVGTVPSLSFTSTTVQAGNTSGISTGAAVTLGPVTINAGSTLIANGSGTKTADSITLSGATGGITAGGTFNMGTYDDLGATKTLTLGGTGTKVMDNSAGGIVAGNTILRIAGGVVDTTATAVGSNDPLGGATAIQMAGGTLKMQGQTTINNNALKATLYNSLPNGAWRGYIEFWSGGNDLRYQTPVATATETGAIWYRSNGSEGKKKWSDLFPGQADEGVFYTMWQGQYKPTVSGNKQLGTWEADNDWEAYVKIGGTWERWRESWRNLDSANWYDIALTYGNWDGYGSIRIPMEQSGYMGWTGLDVSSGNAFGDFRFNTIGALNMSAKTVQVDAASEINMVTDSAVSFGALTVNNGVLTLSGAPSTSFASTTVASGATLIGFNSAGTVDAGVITGNSATGTFVKAGAGTMTLNAGNTGLGTMMFDVQGGKLIVPAPASLGGSVAAQLSGGTLMLSSTSGAVAYDIATTVTQNSTLTAGMAAGGASGQTVTLGSDGKALTVQNGKTLTVNTTDSYVLAINNSVALQDNATMTVAGAANINILGTAALTMGSDSTINLNASTSSLTTDKALDVYNLNLNGGLLTQVTPQDLNVRGTLTVNNSATNLEITGAASLTTASNATIRLVNGTLTTDKPLSVGNLTVESGGTLDMSGTGSDRDITVGDRLRLANKPTWDTTGSTLSVGNRIELENTSLTSGNALTVNTLWMNTNSTISAPSLAVSGTIELYNGSNADFTDKTLSVGGIRMETNATLTYNKPMTINGQIEIYNNSKFDMGSNVLTTNGQNLYIQGNAELKAAGNLNINYLQLWDGGAKLNVPSVTLNDGAQIRSTDSRYGNNVHDFSIAENPGNPGRWMNIYGGGVDRNPWDGSADLYFNGTNTYTGRTQIMDATVLVANDGVGMPTGSTVRFENGVWGTSGTITRTIGEDNTGGGKVFWGNWGGFAAYGGDLTVSLTPDGGVSGDPLFWNSDTQGFRSQGLYLGSVNATHNVTLTNNIEINSNAQISTHSRTKLATLSGDLTGTETLEKQGPGTLALTGDNSGFSGRMYIRRGVLDVGNVTSGNSLGTGRIDLQADTDDPYWKGAILQANGLLAKTIGNDPGNIRWEENGGGFAARGGTLTVTLNGDATINWNDDPSGFRGRRLMFGSGTADDVVTLTNNIDAQNEYRYIYAFDNPNSAIDKAVLSGNLTNLNGLEKRGDGMLEVNGFVTSGEQVRIFDGGTLKVVGNLRAGNEYTDTDPRYIGSSDRNVENYDGKLIVTGNVQANWYYGGGSPANSANDISGNVTLRSHYEQNEGTSHIGGNLQIGEAWVGVRNTTVLTVDGNIRSGAPNGSAADRDVYSWGGGRMIVGGNVAANRLYFEQGKAANEQLPGITVGGTVNLSDGMDLRTGSSTMNNVNSPNYVNLYYGADLTVNGNLVTNSINANEWDYWNYVGERASSVHLNGATAVINGGDGNININANNPSSGYGVLDGSAVVSANYVGLWNKAKLGGTLTLNVKDKVEIGENSVIAPGNSPGTLIIGKNGGTGGNLQMNNGSHYWFEGGDLVDVAGTLTLNDNWNLDILAGGQRLAAGGSITLFKYGTLGTFDDTPGYDVSALIAAGWLPEGFDTGTLSLTALDGSILLNGIQAQPSIWNGGSSVDSNWQTAANWELAPTAGAVLQFGGDKRTTANNNFDAGTTFGGIQFAGGADSFHLVGNDIALAGDIGNSSGNDQVVGLNMEIKVPVSKVDTSSGNVALTGNISGVGGLAKLGGGELTLSGTNSYQGGTAINDGTVSIANDNALGNVSGTLKLAGGTLKTTAGITSARPLNVDTAGGTIDTNTFNSEFSGPVSGSGALTKAGDGTLTLSGTAGSLSGTTSVTGGQLVAKAAILAGPVALSNGANVTLNAAGAAEYSRVISGNGSFTKDGAGTLTMSSVQTYDGATVIKGGTVKLMAQQVLSGFGGDGTGWTRNGSANNVPVADDVLTMSNGGGQSGSAYYDTKVAVNRPFVANYDMDFNGDDSPADEITFILHNDPDGTGTMPGDRHTAGISPSAAVVIDTWNNGTWYDYNGGSRLDQTSTDSPFTHGQWPRTTVTLSYDGSNLLTETLTNATNSSQTMTRTYTVGSLAAQTGADTAYMGWTVGIGGHGTTYSIHDFTFTFPGVGSNLLPTGTALSIGAGSALDLNGVNQQVGSLADESGAGGAVINSASEAAVFTVSPADGSTTFSGTIGGGSGGAISLTKSGAGTQVLSGNLSYAGETIVEAGTLSIKGGLDDASTVTIFDNATAYLDLNFIGTDIIGELVLGTVTMDPDKYYSAINYPSYFTGTGRVHVGAITVLPGDTNDDGVVDAVDYIAIKTNFGLSGIGITRLQGDLIDNDIVDWADLQELLAQFGTRSVGGAPAAPEPATLGLLAIGALAVLRRRRRA